MDRPENRHPYAREDGVCDAPSWIVIGKVELATTALGLLAFEGQDDEVRARLAKGIAWETEGTKALEGAILGGHFALARDLVAAGSPIDDGVYGAAFHHCPACLALLPERLDLVAALEAAKDWFAFNWAIVRGERERVRETLSRRQLDLNRAVLLTHGMGKLAPLHYALRIGDVTTVQMLLAHGADPMFPHPDGRTPAEAVQEDALLSPLQKRALLACLRAAGAQDALPPARSCLDVLRGFFR